MNHISKFDNFILNENSNLNSSDLKFTTPLKNSFTEYYLKNSDFALSNNIPDSDYTIESSHFMILWELSLDAREYGIKDLCIIIRKVIGTITFEIWGEDDKKDLTIDFDSEKLGYEIISNIEISSVIAPDDIEIDFKRKKITIN